MLQNELKVTEQNSRLIFSLGVETRISYLYYTHYETVVRNIAYDQLSVPVYSDVPV